MPQPGSAAWYVTSACWKVPEFEYFWFATTIRSHSAPLARSPAKVVGLLVKVTVPKVPPCSAAS